MSILYKKACPLQLLLSLYRYSIINFNVLQLIVGHSIEYFVEMLLFTSDEGAGITGNYLPSLAVNSSAENNMEFFGQNFSIDKEVYKCYHIVNNCIQ